MSERSLPPLDPKQLLQLKDDILDLWEQLPPEEQASMSVVLLNTVIEDECFRLMRPLEGFRG